MQQEYDNDPAPQIAKGAFQCRDILANTKKRNSPKRFKSVASEVYPKVMSPIHLKEHNEALHSHAISVMKQNTVIKASNYYQDERGGGARLKHGSSALSCKKTSKINQLQIIAPPAPPLRSRLEKPSKKDLHV